MSKNSKKIDERNVEHIGHIHPCFAENAKIEMAEMKSYIKIGNENIDAEIATMRDIPQKAGYIAEEWHAEIYNLKAIYENDEGRALTDRYDGWNQSMWNGRKLARNDVPDLIIKRGDKVTHTSQSKYGKTAEDTAKYMSVPQKDGKDAYYKDMDSMVGPSDQVNSSTRNIPTEKEPVQTTTVSEHARTQMEALEARGGDKAQINSFKNTAEKCTDRIKDGKSSSIPLSKSEAETIAKGDKELLKIIEAEYQTKSTFKHMGNAALGAGAMSGIIGGVKSTINHIQDVKDGTISVNEAVKRIVKDSVSAAADSAVKASVNVGIQSLIVRYGSYETAVTILRQQGMRNILNTCAVSAAATCAVDAIKDLVLFGSGKITKKEFYDRQGKGMLMTSAGVAGGGAGAGAASSVAASLGLGEGIAASTLQIVGGLSGGLIAGMAVNLLIEKIVEKTYQATLQQTSKLYETSESLLHTANDFEHGQKFYSTFVEFDHHMQNVFSNTIDEIDNIGNRLKLQNKRLDEVIVSLKHKRNRARRSTAKAWAAIKSIWPGNSCDEK